MLEVFEQFEASPAFQREMRFSELRHIVVIAVNSRSAPATDWDRKPAPPSVVSQVIQALKRFRQIVCSESGTRRISGRRCEDAAQEPALNGNRGARPRHPCQGLHSMRSTSALTRSKTHRSVAILWRCRRPSSCPRNPSTGCVNWVAGFCATRAADRFRRDSDLFGEGSRNPEVQSRFEAALKRGFQTRDAEMSLGRLLGDLVDR